MAGFPGVIGCVDCTHVRILAPTTNEHEFINRKGQHSINVQLICNAQLRIMNADVKWPGMQFTFKYARYLLYILASSLPSFINIHS